MEQQGQQQRVLLDPLSDAPGETLSARIAPISRARSPPPERGMFLMQSPNSMIEIVREVYERISRLFFADQLLEKIDYIPIEMRPMTAPSFRCCIYRDRAMVRYRILAALGLRVEKEADECRSLASYAQEALGRQRQQLPGPALTVLEECCNHCMRAQYYVTDACQGCIARPCATNCPKKAIEHDRGRAVIDADACIRCGKCMQVCPYHAIINLPIPCVQACPVGAITALPDGEKHFDWGKCIYCGSCQRACPFGAVMDRSQIIEVLKALKDPKEKVVAMIAPAAAGHFGNAPIWAIVDAFKKAGFFEALEVSLGADMTAEEESREFQHKFGPGSAKQKHPFMTTSCCPAYINCIRKHAQEIEEAISNTPTPMHFTAKLSKERWPGCTAVFIGPCVAKLQEAVTDTYTDYALTFVEAMGILRGRNVVVETMLQPPAGYNGNLAGSLEGRGFPIVGGVAQAVIALTPEGGTRVQPVVIDGLSAQAVRKLKSFAKAPPPGNLVEVMVCEGGCVSGPGCVSQPNVASGRVKALLAKSAHHQQATPAQPGDRAPVVFRNGVLVQD
eukprot:m51a1_g9814 putative ferredoxin hydrogenase (561) ;mRNA; f:1860032-1863078